MNIYATCQSAYVFDDGREMIVPGIEFPAAKPVAVGDKGVYSICIDIPARKEPLEVFIFGHWLSSGWLRLLDLAPVNEEKRKALFCAYSKDQERIFGISVDGHGWLPVYKNAHIAEHENRNVNPGRRYR